LRKAFKNVTGLSFHQFADARRLDRLKTLLRQGRDVTGALYDAGYSSTSRLYEKAPAQLGMTPNTYRNGGQNVQITYTIVNRPFGQVLVAATDKGVCAVRLGDDDASLEAGLKKEYPKANVERVDGQLHEWVGLMLATLDGHPVTHSLPLDVGATAFQRRVWQHLMTIPRGETRTYGQVAEAIDEPRSARAVANACAANPVALAVPCHRVVRRDGGLGGYRWGMERKAALLEIESISDSDLSIDPPFEVQVFLGQMTSD
jgi:AraC family transcriptional regulator of adaptative response/methylated-DNA-[protein]-cysteine methyltransferase